MKKGSGFDDQPVVSEQHGVRYLHFDSPWIQGAMAMHQPDKLVLSYTEQMLCWLLFLEPPADQVIGQLGLGAASITRFCYKNFANPLVVVERNPAVVRICEQYFRLPKHSRVRVIQEDAGKWVLNPANSQTLSVLMVDLYDTDALGPVCDSQAFYEGCFYCLAAPGILSVNLFGLHESFERNLDRIKSAFNGRVVLLPPVEQGNQIVLGFKGPTLAVSKAELLDRARWLEHAYQLPAMRWARSIGALDGL